MLRACFKQTFSLGLGKRLLVVSMEPAVFWTPEATGAILFYTQSNPSPENKQALQPGHPCPTQRSCVPKSRAGYVCKGAEVNWKGSQLQLYLKEWFPKWKFMLGWPQLITQKIRGPMTEANNLHPVCELDISSAIVQRRLELALFVTSLGRC